MVPSQPRARGAAHVGVRSFEQKTRLSDLHQSGSLKLLFPRTGRDAVTAVALNTAGGITGGDRFELSARSGAKGHLVVTTQAAERAYRAQPGQTGAVTTRLALEDGARLDWLPQELIVFEGAALHRTLEIAMTDNATLLAVEPVVFGRAAMGETLRAARLRDRITLRRGGEVIFADRTALEGDIDAHLRSHAIGAGAGAMASVIYAAPDAERFLAPARALMPATGGVSLIRDGLLFARLLAADGFELRRALLPLITCLSPEPIPRTWTI